MESEVFSNCNVMITLPAFLVKNLPISNVSAELTFHTLGTIKLYLMSQEMERVFLFVFTV